MTEPYYSDDHATLYHGDCLAIMPDLDFDLIVTDPPYGISLKTDYSTNPLKANDGRVIKKNRGGKVHRAVVGDDKPFDPTPWLKHPVVFTGANNFAQRLPETGRWHVWDKTGGGQTPTGLGNEFEVVWTSFPSGRSRVFHIPWAGFLRLKKFPDSFQHPTTKPESLMRQLIEMAPPGVILDPFMGSGTTLRAAKDLGRRSIGIEIDEAYCEIAANRLAQEVLPL